MIASYEITLLAGNAHFASIALRNTERDRKEGAE